MRVSSPDVDLPPCDFDAFVAERRGIGRRQAQELIASWIACYEPVRRASFTPRPMDPQPEA